MWCNNCEKMCIKSVAEMEKKNNSNTVKHRGIMNQLGGYNSKRTPLIFLVLFISVCLTIQHQNVFSKQRGLSLLTLSHTASSQKYSNVSSCSHSSQPNNILIRKAYCPAASQLQSEVPVVETQGVVLD